MFCHFDHDLEEIEFSNPAHLEELEKIMILKKSLSKTDLPFRFYKFGLRNTLFFLRENGRVCFVCCLLQTLPGFDVLF